MRDLLWTDLRLGVRTLRRSPAFTVAAVGVLGIGIGVSAGVFSAVDSLLLRPVPYAENDRVVAISPVGPGISVSKATLERLRERQRSFESVAGYSRWGFVVQATEGAELIQGAVGTANLFVVLGARPLMGRTFEAGDDTPGRSAVAVLSYEYWQRRYAGSRDVVGTTVTLNGTSHTIVGVMPPRFDYPVTGTELWTPTILNPGDRFDYASAGYLLLVGRRLTTASLAATEADVRRATREMRDAFADAYSAQFGNAATVVPLREATLGATRLVLLMSFGAVALILLIGCANVGNLVIARATGRLRDLAVRTALGATRRDLIRLVLSEMILLGLAGGVVGVGVAFLTSRGIAALLPQELPGASTVTLDVRVLAFTSLLSVATGVVCGLFPALRLSREVSLRDRLAAGEGRQTADSGARQTMSALLVTESATAMLLAMGAGLMLQTVWKLARADTGFSTTGVVAFDVVVPRSISGPERQIAFYDDLASALGRIGGVGAVGSASPLPFSGAIQLPALSIEGITAPADQDRSVDWRRVTPGYFATMGISLTRGRMLNDGDRAGSTPVALINETLARQRFGGADPIGRRVQTVLDGSEWATIVGIVRDTKATSIQAAPPPQMYRPLAQRPAGFSSFVVRTNGDVGVVMRGIGPAVHAVHRDAVLLRPRLTRDMLGESFRQRSTLATILGAFAGLALLLGALGVAALAAYRVSQRRRELALRMALGAVRRDVALMVMRETLTLTAIGVGIGSAAAFGLTRLLESQLYGVASFDLPTLLAAIGLLCVAAIIASWLPARAATRVDPASALRGT
jgi:predicted permease